MELTVKRYRHQKESTQGLFYIDGVFECYTLEDEFRVVKKWGETCIPNGRYKVGLRTEGKFHNRYKDKFSNIHKGMLHVTNVPNFKYILIHIGNYTKDTAGCLLVGAVANDGFIQHSTVAYRRMYEKIIKAFDNNEDVFITYESI